MPPKLLKAQSSSVKLGTYDGDFKIVDKNNRPLNNSSLKYPTSPKL